MADEQVDQGQSPPPDTAAVERQARDMGWQTKDQWRGPPEGWVDAHEYVKRGETFVPFLRAERTRLRSELSVRDQRLTQMEAQLNAANQQLEDIRSVTTEIAKDRAAQRKTELGTAIKAAREAGDDVKVAELTAELNETAAKKPAAPPERREPPNNAPTLQPWVKTFLDSNQGFFQDPRKVAYFNSEMLVRRNQGDRRVGDIEGTALLQEAMDTVENMLGGQPVRRQNSRAEEPSPPNGGSSGARGNGRGYSDLPFDVRSKCDAQEERFVGPKKMFKNQADWRKYYATEYFSPTTLLPSREPA